ncbi:MAG TPA: ABC transporter permease, partial [Blastocatellia bacterium]|nr:ABC transporter permease [Blastocatellia bacterium]
MMATVWYDLRYGVRMLRKSPGFTLVALLMLVVGIGANTAIFQLMDAVLLRTLPVERPDELVHIQIADMTGARGNFTSSRPPVTNPVWERIRDSQQAFSGVLAWGDETFNLNPAGEARFAQGLWVSGDFFNVLGVRPALGRVFTPDDDRRGCGSAGAVISDRFWKSEFGADRAVIGRKLTLEGMSFDIIGVTPASFSGLDIGHSFDIAIPICTEPLFSKEDSVLDSGVTWWLTVMGRLKPGWTPEQASSHLASISPGIFEATLAANYPVANAKDYLGFKLSAVEAGKGFSQLRETYTKSLWLLLSISGLVLLIACANIANLMLARATLREREIAVRLALGASRGRLMRQLMTESLLLAAAGTIGGFLLASQLSDFLVSFLSTEGDHLFINLQPDLRVLAFAAGLAALTCVLFGLTPALRSARTAPGAVLKASGRGLTVGRERVRLRQVLVVVQVALSLILVLGAVLFSRSLRNLATVDPGFDPKGVMVASVDLGKLKLPPGQRQSFKRQLIERIETVPGVISASDANIVPLFGSSWGNDVWMDGSSSAEAKNSLFTRVNPDYFRTITVPLIAGRDFDDRDTAESAKVAIVNEAFARTVNGGANPVGARFRRQPTPRDPETVFEVVGLVRNTKYNDLREEFHPIAYLMASQDPRPSEFDRVIVKSAGPAASLLTPVKSAINAFNPDITIVGSRIFETEIANTLLRE